MGENANFITCVGPTDMIKNLLFEGIEFKAIQRYKTELIKVVKETVNDLLEDNREDAGAILAAVYLASYTMFKAVETAVLKDHKEDDDAEIDRKDFN